MSTVIKVENLSKRYRLGVINRDMLYKDLQSRWARFRGKEDPNVPIGAKHDKRLEHGDEFWALRNVDLEVKEGEILGIIGRNGAGKSTLLKILSQITAPTEGRIKVKGRIASLLEVGTGFHPELTGRENVFLNGAILGMTRKEVRSKFDEIVAFAEIDEFIDTPVKRYSSGMYVRLAFAVAAHLDPEILIVDEVLAVGDAEFQKKCLNKMETFGRVGRTVIFVSHQLQSVRKLCTRAILISEGAAKDSGDPDYIITAYINADRSEHVQPPLAEIKERSGLGDIVFASVSVLSGRGEVYGGPASGEACSIILDIYNNTDARHYGIEISIDIYDQSGNRVMMMRSDMIGKEIELVEKRKTIRFSIERLPLVEGQYTGALFLAKKGHDPSDYIERAFTLRVREGNFFGTGHPGYPIHCKMMYPFRVTDQ